MTFRGTLEYVFKKRETISRAESVGTIVKQYGMSALKAWSKNIVKCNVLIGMCKQFLPLIGDWI